jgi:hypothetical protein
MEIILDNIRVTMIFCESFTLQLSIVKSHSFKVTLISVLVLHTAKLLH